MRRQVMEHNIYRWAAMVLGDLRDVRLEDAESAEMYSAGPVSEPVIADAQRKMA